jgi:hypothetical protein
MTVIHKPFYLNELRSGLCNIISTCHNALECTETRFRLLLLLSWLYSVPSHSSINNIKHTVIPECLAILASSRVTKLCCQTDKYSWIQCLPSSLFFLLKNNVSETGFASVIRREYKTQFVSMACKVFLWTFYLKTEAESSFRNVVLLFYNLKRWTSPKEQFLHTITHHRQKPSDFD